MSRLQWAEPYAWNKNILESDSIYLISYPPTQSNPFTC